jgi:hypothetical protein
MNMTPEQTELANLLRQIEKDNGGEQISLRVEWHLMERGALPPSWRQETLAWHPIGKESPPSTITVGEGADGADD